MEREAYEAFRAETWHGLVPVVTAEELSAGGDRTLTLGYNTERETLHVYLEVGEIHAFWYSGERVLAHVQGAELYVHQLTPNKRVYPEYTDLEFARLMRERTEMGLPFTTWSEPRWEGPFHGRRYYGG